MAVREDEVILGLAGKGRGHPLRPHVFLRSLGIHSFNKVFTVESEMNTINWLIFLVGLL